VHGACRGSMSPTWRMTIPSGACPPGPLWLQRPDVGPRTRKRWRLLYTRTRSYDTLHWSQGTPAHCLSISYGATDEPRWEPLPDLRLPVESKKGFAEVASKQNIGIFEEEDAMMSKRWPGHRLPTTAMHHTPYGAPRVSASSASAASSVSAPLPSRP